MNAAAFPWRLRHHASLPSTSDLCIALAEAGEPEGCAILADRQTAGRGTRGRAWDAPAGNLNLSVLLRPSGDAVEAGRWALIAGLALHQALATETLRLKWPNDILLDGRKLAGVLIDTALDADGRLRWLVIGCGANLAAAPSITGRPTACLAELGPAPDPRVAAARLLDRLVAVRRMRQLDGFPAIRAAWLAASQPIGSPIAIRRGDSVTGGTFAGLSDDGGLLLQTGGRVQCFATGETLLEHG